MITNKKVSKNINQWTLEIDPNGFLKDQNWLINSELTEDILQLTHINSEGPVIDVGFYNDYFKIFIIYNLDWENPKEIFESSDVEIVSQKIYQFIDKYAKE